MNTENKEIRRVSKDELVKLIAKDSSLTASAVKTVFESFENVLFDQLKQADEDIDVTIRIMDGFYIDSVFVPECTKKNNLTGAIINVPSKIKVKSRTTRGFVLKVNS